MLRRSNSDIVTVNLSCRYVRDILSNNLCHGTGDWHDIIYSISGEFEGRPIICSVTEFPHPPITLLVMFSLFILAVLFSAVLSFDSPQFISSTFSSNMVLQRDTDSTIIFGWSKAASSTLTIEASWFNGTIEAQAADKDDTYDDMFFWEARWVKIYTSLCRQGLPLTHFIILPHPPSPLVYQAVPEASPPTIFRSRRPRGRGRTWRTCFLGMSSFARGRATCNLGCTGCLTARLR